MKTLVVSCYELGRQPVAAASAIAALEQAGLSPRALDVSVDALSDAALRDAELILISVPMHTALQLGVRVARRAREVNPAARVVFFGLYAVLNAEHLRAKHCDAVAGEAPGELVAIATGSPAAERRDLVPSRASLPALSRYARLEHHGESRLVASVEATRGCKHLCRHCPIVPVYQGKFIAVPAQTVLSDIEQQIAQGAQHVTFGDPDFLNGPTHALRIARELHQRWPGVTFDATIKIEHLLQHRALLDELVQCGMIFVTSAVESLNDEVLSRLDKGHTSADVPLALKAVRDAGAEVRPTLLPYTPWTRLGDLPALLDFALEHELVDCVDPVQFTLRLLLPPGSLLVDRAAPWLRAFDERAFSWTWQHEDPRVDALCRESSQAVHAGAGFDELYELATRRKARFTKRRAVPRLSEPWFC